MPSTGPKLLNLNQDHSLEKLIFMVKSLKSLNYDNFSHRNARVTNFGHIAASTI